MDYLLCNPRVCLLLNAFACARKKLQACNKITLLFNKSSVHINSSCHLIFFQTSLFFHWKEFTLNKSYEWTLILSVDSPFLWVGLPQLHSAETFNAFIIVTWVVVRWSLVIFIAGKEDEKSLNYAVVSFQQILLFVDGYMFTNQSKTVCWIWLKDFVVHHNISSGSLTSKLIIKVGHEKARCLWNSQTILKHSWGIWESFKLIWIKAL